MMTLPEPLPEIAAILRALEPCLACEYSEVDGSLLSHCGACRLAIAKAVWNAADVLRGIRSPSIPTEVVPDEVIKELSDSFGPVADCVPMFVSPNAQRRGEVEFSMPMVAWNRFAKAVHAVLNRHTKDASR